MVSLQCVSRDREHAKTKEKEGDAQRPPSPGIGSPGIDVTRKNSVQLIVFSLGDRGQRDICLSSLRQEREALHTSGCRIQNAEFLLELVAELRKTQTPAILLSRESGVGHKICVARAHPVLPGPRWPRHACSRPVFLSLDGDPLRNLFLFSPYTLCTINQPVLTPSTRRRSNYVLEHPGSVSSIFSFWTRIRCLQGVDVGDGVSRHFLTTTTMRWGACSQFALDQLNFCAKFVDVTEHHAAIDSSHRPCTMCHVFLPCVLLLHRQDQTGSHDLVASRMLVRTYRGGHVPSSQLCSRRTAF